ncbi:MAG: FHA domain-containing protein, partial [Bacteroidetes bacterium]|nr:FHA domain-containing protein [Bacteroidota bacterium]
MFSRLRTSSPATLPPVRVRVVMDDVSDDGAAAQTFSVPVQIGREASCAVHVPAPNVSRIHAATEWAEGTWWVVDQNSTNGLFAGGTRMERVPVQGATEVRLGKDGPVVVLTAERGASDAKPVPKRAASQGRPFSASGARTGPRERAATTGAVPPPREATGADDAARLEGGSV